MLNTLDIRNKLLGDVFIVGSINLFSNENKNRIIAQRTIIYS